MLNTNPFSLIRFRFLRTRRSIVLLLLLVLALLMLLLMPGFALSNKLSSLSRLSEEGAWFWWPRWWQNLWLASPISLIGMGVAGLISWSVWLTRMVLSRFYKPVVNDFRTTTSVVAPCYREDPDVLIRCLESWLMNNPRSFSWLIWPIPKCWPGCKPMKRIRACG